MRWGQGAGKNIQQMLIHFSDTPKIFNTSWKWSSSCHSHGEISKGNETP